MANDLLDFGTKGQGWAFCHPGKGRRSADIVEKLGKWKATKISAMYVVIDKCR
jgi:hypothetical protein